MVREVHPELLDRFLFDLGIVAYAYEHWRCGKDFPQLRAVTDSSNFAQFCTF